MGHADVSALRFLLILFLLEFTLASGYSQAANPEGEVTMTLLESRTQQVEKSLELSDSVKTLIQDQYRRIVADLELARSFDEQREALRAAFHRTPAEVEAIRNAIDQQREVDPTRNLQSLENTSDEDLERLLDQELTDQKAAEMRQKNLNDALEEELQRPALVRERIINAKLLLEEANRQQGVSPPTGMQPLQAEAEQWAVEARIAALKAEISMLDQQLLGNRSQVRLIRTQQEEAQQNSARIQTRLELIRTELRDRRQREEEQTIAQADSILKADTLLPVALRQLAESNLELVAVRQQQAVLSDSLDRAYNRLQPISQRLTNAFSSAQRKLGLEASNAPLGRIIREERARLPQLKTLLRGKKEMNQLIATVSLRLIESEEERQAISSPDLFLGKFMEEYGVDSLDAEARTKFGALAATRLELLERTTSNDVNLERKLYTLSELLDELIEKTKEYDGYLGERLLWVRSAPPFEKNNFANLTGSLRFFLSPGNWTRCGRQLIAGLWQNPLLLLLLLLAAVLVWQRKRIQNALSVTGRQRRPIYQDNVSHTITAIGYTLLIALPLPLILWSAGASLTAVSEQDLFSAGISRGLIRISRNLFYLSFLRDIFNSGGLADLHLSWSKPELAKMRKLLDRFMGFGLPFYFLTICFANIFPPSQGGGLGLLSFTGYMAALSWFIYAFGRLALDRMRVNRSAAWLNWIRFLLGLSFIIPPALVIMAWTGYTFTAVEFYFRLEWSIWLFTFLWLISFIARRWLLIMQGKLVHQAIQQKREAAKVAAREGARPSSAVEAAEEVKEDTQAELVNLDNDTRQLFDAALILAAVVGLVAIWGEVLPALGVLDEITLWRQTYQVNGVEQSSTVTFGDFLRAIVYGVIAYVLGKNLPSLINILLLKQGKTSSGARYAISTLLQYAIALFGLLAVLGALGATGAQLGWAAAALGVGIGFGLQEIVANFVSGIILLFERPVRIGDVVTIGDASGTVTSIQIRATTIRDWEKKELLVPNKELITGRLINWTLSDSITRVQIKVGVAYESDVEKALQLMRETAHNNKRVLQNPTPFAFFEQFGDSTLTLTLNAFVGEVSDRLEAITELNQEINRKFKEAGIEIAFPQLDVHVRPQS